MYNPRNPLPTPAMARRGVRPVAAPPAAQTNYVYHYVVGTYHDDGTYSERDLQTTAPLPTTCVPTEGPGSVKAHYVESIDTYMVDPDQVCPPRSIVYFYHGREQLIFPAG